jgi:Fe-S cluster assembly protein SufD
MSHPRNLILAGEASQAAIVEVYAGDAGGNYFTNAVTELLAGETAVIEHYKLQQESQEAFHVATLQVRQQRSSNFAAHSVSLGGALVRNNVNAVLDGDGAQCTLNGLYLAGGRQHVDTHTVLDHAKPHCGSREYYKGILDGRSSAVFNGGIVVRKDAQKTDAIQSNKNLLLSKDAVINTKPQLQIWADDVRCTHGATIGQLDSEALFYLRSRGIGHDEARHLLTFAFANDVLGRMKLEELRAHLERQMFARLSKRSDT